MSASAGFKRNRRDSVTSDCGEKRVRHLQTSLSQEVLTLKQVCDLIQYVTLAHTHTVTRPSWWGVSQADVTPSRVNVMILEGLTQTHFYRHFSVFTNLSHRYLQRWSLSPALSDPLSVLLSADVTGTEVVKDAGANQKVRGLTWHPVIRRFGSQTTSLAHVLLTEQEMRKHNFPWTGGSGCEGFRQTLGNSPMTNSSPLFGLDCEMCLTTAGSEVTRVAVVDQQGCCVLDELIKPHNPITDYCTQFSGITPLTLACVETRLCEVQEKLLRLLPSDAVLVGHSLENDLRALQMIHPHVIDTSLLFRREGGQRFKLKVLAAVVLKREIQVEGGQGHDPCEDARAALHLAQHFIRRGPGQVLQDHLEDLWNLYPEISHSDQSASPTPSLSNHTSQNFGHALHKAGQSVIFLGRSQNGLSSNQLCRRHNCNTDREAVCVFKRVCQSYTISVLRFSSYSDTLKHTPVTTQQQILQQMCCWMREMCVLYIGPLPSETTEKNIHTLLKHYGGLQSVQLLHHAHTVYAEVVFQHLEGAKLALQHLDTQHIRVRRPVYATAVDVEERMCAREPDIVNSGMIYVCNMRKRADEQQLRSTFSVFGPIAAVHYGEGHRHAFIRFEKPDGAQAAENANLQIGNRKLWVSRALTPSHMTCWTPAHDVTMEKGRQVVEESEESLMKKLDRKVGKLFRSMETNTLSIVILPGRNIGGVDHPGLCFLQMKDSM